MKMSFSAVLCALAAVPIAAQANLLVNGSFEDPLIADGTYALFTSIPGWTLASGPSIELQRNIAGSPYDGLQFLELDSDANSSVYQDVSTVVGAPYSLRFAYTPRPGVGAASNGVDVFVNGSSVASLTGIGGAGTAWQVYEFLFTGNGSSRIQFTGVGISDSLGGYIDAVSVDRTRPADQPVPEPNAFSLLLAGALAGCACMRPRRKSV
jgi:hypothetical protein